MYPESGSTLLSIGAGYGDVEIQMARDYKPSHVAIVEPSPDMVAGFVRAAEKDGLSFDADAMTFDEYMRDEKSQGQQWDFVVAVHAWYGIGYDTNALDQALSLVKPGGRFWNQISSEKNFTGELIKLANPERVSYMMTAEKLSAWMTKEGYEHTFDLQHSLIPTEVIFADGTKESFTQLGTHIVSYMFWMPWDEIAPEKQQQCIDVLYGYIDGVEKGYIAATSGNMTFHC